VCLCDGFVGNGDAVEMGFFFFKKIIIIIN
jgi:hypothetical protein